MKRSTSLPASATGAVSLLRVTPVAGRFAAESVAGPRCIFAEAPETFPRRPRTAPPFDAPDGPPLLCKPESLSHELGTKISHIHPARFVGEVDGGGFAPLVYEMPGVPLQRVVPGLRRHPLEGGGQLQESEKTPELR